MTAACFFPPPHLISFISGSVNEASQLTWIISKNYEAGQSDNWRAGNKLEQLETAAS